MLSKKVYIIALGEVGKLAPAYMEVQVSGLEAFAFAHVHITRNECGTDSGGVTITGKGRKSGNAAMRDVPTLKRVAINAAIDLGILPKDFKLAKKIQCFTSYSSGSKEKS